MEKINLLVVGSSGSIGQNLIQKICDQYTVFAIDKNHLEDNSNKITFLQCDLTDIDSITKIVNKIPNKLVILYLAGNLTNSFEKNNITNSFNDNVFSLINFLTNLNSKISHFIYISSISIYGIPKYNPIDEKHPISPFSLYGCMKACSEIITMNFCKHFQIPYTVLRTTQLYGISSANNTLPHILVNELKSGKIPQIISDPECKRDYLHISDFIEFITKLIDSPKEGIYNLGSGNGISILELFKIAFEAKNISFDSSKLINTNLKQSFSIVLDISKTQSNFDFYPKMKIDDWINQNLNSF